MFELLQVKHKFIRIIYKMAITGLPACFNNAQQTTYPYNPSKILLGKLIWTREKYLFLMNEDLLNNLDQVKIIFHFLPKGVVLWKFSLTLQREKQQLPNLRNLTHFSIKNNNISCLKMSGIVANNWHIFSDTASSLRFWNFWDVQPEIH